MEHTVEITALAYGGRGVGRRGTHAMRRGSGKVVFVPYTAPGDVARVKIITEKKGFSEGVLIGLETPSPIRQEPPCPVYGQCGGCHLQHIKYPEQVGLKQGIFEETLKRLGGVKDIPYDESVPSPEPFNYRRRAHFHVNSGRWGFYESLSHRVVDIAACPLLDGRINTAFAAIKNALKGCRALAGVTIGVSEPDGMTAAAFNAAKHGTPPEWDKALAGVKGLKGFEVRDAETKKVTGTYGDTSLLFSIDDLSLRSGIGVFSQVNMAGNQRLVEKALLYADIAGEDVVLDLFSGAGNLTLPFARRARDVTGVESNRTAVEEAKANATANGITNASFHAGDATRWLARNIKTLEKNRPAVVILDPPRRGIPSSGGMPSNAAGALEKLKPGKIIYVSCSPPTLARDLRALATAGYKVFRAGLIDMFPQTYHMECVAGLVRTA